MSRRLPRALLPWLAASSLAGCDLGASAGKAAPLRINGSTTVNPIAAEAAEILRAERGLEILVDTQGGSSGGIALLGEGRVEIGMSSRPIEPSDRARFPGAEFVAHRVGVDAVALVVSADVWEAGVRSLSRDQMRAIYERRVTSWREVGGPDLPIAFFVKEPGRGTWEVFAAWLYGSARDAPAARFPEVGGNEETRSKVASTRGALSQLSVSWADGATVFALAIEQQGSAVAPTPAAIASGAYPMSRALLLVTNGSPAGDARAFLDLVLSSRGQALVRKHGFLALADLER